MHLRCSINCNIFIKKTRNQNYDRPRRTIRSLSKQAKKEWMYKHRNASSFNWDEEKEKNLLY